MKCTWGGIKSNLSLNQFNHKLGRKNGWFFQWKFNEKNIKFTLEDLFFAHKMLILKGKNQFLTEWMLSVKFASFLQSLRYVSSTQKSN